MWASVNTGIADVAGFLINPSDVVLVSPKRLSWASFLRRALHALLADYGIIDSAFVVLQNPNP